MDVSDLSGTITGTGKLSLIYGRSSFAVFGFLVFLYRGKRKEKTFGYYCRGNVCLIVLLTGTDAGRAQYRYVKSENEGQKVYMEGMKEVLDYCNGNAEKKFLLDGFSFNYYKGSALETEVTVHAML